MGHKSKFTFPVPRRRNKQPPVQASASTAPLTKAQRILGTSEINIDAPVLPGGDVRQWDAGSMSGISISISESSASYTSTKEAGLGILRDGEDGAADGAAGTSQSQMAWDEESAIIPFQMRTPNGVYGAPPRTQKSEFALEFALGRDCATTDDSSHRRCQSSSSTIFSHYDKHKVPLAISQQTSNSAMAKGLPMKANALLDMDGRMGDAVDKKKKKSARLDLSLLRSRSRKGRKPHDIGPLSPSALPQMTAMAPSASLPRRGLSHRTHGRVAKTQSGIVITPTTSNSLRQRGTNDLTGLQQLHYHYEESTFRRVPWIPTPPHFEPLTMETDLELSPPPNSPSSLPIPLTSRPIAPMSGISDTQLTHEGNRDSTTSVNTSASGSGLNALPSHLTPGKDDASSVSSRHTRTSKASRTDKSSILLDADLQLNSVLSLSDSDSDEDVFSDAGPKSSMSSHGNFSSHDDVFAPSARHATGMPPIVQERVASKSKYATFAPFNDYLTIPNSSSSRSHNVRMPSNGTLRSSASSASTATATLNGSSGMPPDRSSRLSTTSTSTTDSVSPPTFGYGIHEAKAISIVHLASTMDGAMSASPKTPGVLERTRIMRERLSNLSRNPDQPTPPISPSDIESHLKSPQTPEDVPGDPSSTFMVVTKQEQMLLAALRAKRAKMREHFGVSTESGASSAGSNRSHSRGSSTTGSESKQVSAIVGKIEAMDLRNKPRPPIFPSRSSSLLPGLKNLTKERERIGMSGRRIIAHRPSSSRDSDLGKKRFELALHNARFKDDDETNEKQYQQYHQRQQSIPLILDRPSIKEVPREPSPGPSDFMKFSGESEDDSDFSPVASTKPSNQNTNCQIPGSPPVDLARSDSNGYHRVNLFRAHLSGVPEVEHDTETYEFADFDGVHHGQETSSEKYTAHPDTQHSPPADRLQVPIGAYSTGKNSAARLSAVGRASSPTAWWGDDD